MSVRKSLIMSAAVAFLTAGALAQNQGNNGGGGQGGGGNQQGGGGGRGNWDPAQMQQRMLERVKEQMKAPEDEWKVIEPKLTKVVTAQRDARAGGGGRGGRGGQGGGGQGGGDQQQPQTELARAARELRELLQQENAAPDQISSKLTSFRAARDKANTELKTAREALKEVLNERQEAVLVTMDVLE